MVFVLISFLLRPRRKREDTEEYYPVDEYIKRMEPYARRIGLSIVDLKAGYWAIVVESSVGGG